MMDWDKALRFSFLFKNLIHVLPEVQRRMIHRVLITTSGPGIGSPRAQCLIIGDRPTEENEYKLPFVHPTGCAPWLAEQLEQACIPEEVLYWINAYDVKGDPTNLDGLGFFEVGCMLGENAAKRSAELLEYCDTVVTFSHPQYWKRFHSKEPYPLITALETYV